MTKGFLTRALLALVILDIPFHCDIHLGYNDEMAELNALGGLSISVTTFCLAALYALWLVKAALGVSPGFRPRPRVSPWLIVYLVAVCCSVFVASHLDLAAYEIFMLVQTFLIYVYIVKTLGRREDIFLVTNLLITSMLLHAVVMIGLLGIGHNVHLGPFLARIESGMRVGGTFGSPNGAASFISLLLAPCLAMQMAGRSRRQRWLAMVALLVGTFALVVTLTRGGWLAGGVSVSLFCICTWRRGWLSPMAPLAFGACAALAVTLYVGAIGSRLTFEEGSTVMGRLTLIELAYDMAIDNPLFGVGANNFAANMDRYIAYLDLPGTWLHTVHNKYMLVWAENGPLGLLAFACFLTAMVRQGWRTWKIGNGIIALLGLAFGVGVLGQMLHMNMDLFNSRPQLQVLFVVAGILTVLDAMARHDADQSSHENLAQSTTNSSMTVLPRHYE
jgi:O-antigen ligase